MNTLIPGRWEHKPEAELESRACLVQGQPARASKPLAFAALIATAMVLMGGFPRTAIPIEWHLPRPGSSLPMIPP